MVAFRTRSVCYVIFFIGVFCSTSFAMGSLQTARPPQKTAVVKEFVWNEHRNKPSKEQQVGVAIFHQAVRVDYNRNKKQILQIEFKEPVMIYQADKPQKWGFVQFPRIFRVSHENKIAAVWNLNEDDITAKQKNGWRYSKDNGKTWFFRWAERPSDLGLLLPDGNRLSLNSRKIDLNRQLSVKPMKSTQNSKGESEFQFFKKSDLPDTLTCFYISRSEPKRNKAITEYAPINNDEKQLRYSRKGVLSLQAWGNVRIMPDGALMTCQYPVYMEENGKTDKLSGVGFYKSTDNGHSWTMISHIPFETNPAYESKNEKRDVYGFTEPAFEILNNGVMICVLRSSIGVGSAPMYMAVSRNNGKSWSKPQIIANNGVLPQLLKLDNGITVLSSGRPGVQLRFMDNPNTMIWTDAFEMLRFKDLKGQVSCGYTGLLPTGSNSFLMIYSDFKSRNADNHIRKAILVREVVVKKYRRK